MSTDPSTPENEANLSGLGRALLESKDGSKPSGPWVPPTAEELGKLLPDYEILKMLGRGGMGAVYMGRQKSLDRPVAIKILSTALEDADPSFAERFKNEARAMGKLNHPGIVAVHDFGEAAGGLLYIVMEFVEGTDVAKMISKEGRLHTEHAMAITAHVCDALAYAHERGIIHRDIKPANIMVGYDGVVKVADFGLAKMTQSPNTGLTQSGMAMGTLHYMAPEALMLGSAVDHRADIYAVGVMLYQMLTGKIPQGMFRLPSLQIPGLDPRYDGIITKAIMEDREARYQSVGEMRRDLDGILTQPVVKVEAEVSQAPAALPTMARPQRPGAGKPYRPPQSVAHQKPATKSSSGWLVWAVLGVLVLGGAYWRVNQSSERSRVRENVAETPPERVQANAVTSTPATATKDNPFVNTLGMKFVPVPITGGPTAGQRVLFSVWETRVQDYEAFVKETKRKWPKPDFEQGPSHPAVNISLEDAQAFCAWLTSGARATKHIGLGEHFRLPSDHEWSCAVGIGEIEDASKPHAEKSTLLAGIFPWGTTWPPPENTGNYGSDDLWRAQIRKPGSVVPEMRLYRDGHVATSPVGIFSANPSGLFDLGGNAWEICEIAIGVAQPEPVYRGASWFNADKNHLRSSRRNDIPPNPWERGFRCVLATSPNAAAVSSTAPASPKVSTFPGPSVPVPVPLAPPPAFHLQQLPDFLTRIANYQKARHAQLSDLTTKYRAALTAAKDAATKSGVLADATAAESAVAAATAFAQLIEANLSATEVKPLPALATVAEPAPQRLKELRDIFVREVTKIEGGLVTSLDQSLATVQTTLVQAAKLTEAKAVEDYRKAMLAAFKVADPPPANVPVASVPAIQSSGPALNQATKDKPFINSLGMKFVPVPGTEVLMCIHETRKGDYAAYAAANPNIEGQWKNVAFMGELVSATDDHPVVMLNRMEAKDFCTWLSGKEGRTYRLPTDREWSCAAGLGALESATALPPALHQGNEGVYPWGTTWPPPDKAANLADQALARLSPKNDVIADYNDGHATTAPVMSFMPNQFGIYDLAGNVWEWCNDNYNLHAALARGSGWKAVEQIKLLASHRQTGPPNWRDGVSGFRIVLQLP